MKSKVDRKSPKSFLPRIALTTVASSVTITDSLRHSVDAYRRLSKMGSLSSLTGADSVFESAGKAKAAAKKSSDSEADLNH